VITKATTLISISRDLDTDDEDAYGDPVEPDTFVAQHIPASIIETTRYIATADKDQPMVVRYVTGRINSGINIQDDDRIYDEWGNCWYEINSISQSNHPARRNDIRLELKRVT
jgi:hypothetical protein